jgi:hypothetical protein
VRQANGTERWRMAKAKNTEPHERLFRWRISIFGKKARTLGSIRAPDDEKAAITKGIKFFHIDEKDHFRVAAQKLEEITPALSETD